MFVIVMVDVGWILVEFDVGNDGEWYVVFFVVFVEWYV